MTSRCRPSCVDCDELRSTAGHHGGPWCKSLIRLASADVDDGAWAWPLPQLASSACAKLKQPLPADPHSVRARERTCHPEIRVRRDAPCGTSLLIGRKSPSCSLFGLFCQVIEGTASAIGNRASKRPWTNHSQQYESHYHSRSTAMQSPYNASKGITANIH